MTTRQETTVVTGGKRISDTRGWHYYPRTRNWLLVVALFSLCAGSTFISYQPYQFDG